MTKHFDGRQNGGGKTNLIEEERTEETAVARERGRMQSAEDFIFFLSGIDRSLVSSSFVPAGPRVCPDGVSLTWPAKQARVGAQEKTRWAILRLSENRYEFASMQIMFDENREVIERAVERNLGIYGGPETLDMVVAGMARNARLYCDEAEDPYQWVARSANLESRRVRHQLQKWLPSSLK
jgi:hypothetical protein